MATNQQIYMQGLNQEAKEKAERILSALGIPV